MPAEPIIASDRLRASATLGGREIICDGISANLCNDGYSLRLWGVRRPASAPTATASNAGGSVAEGVHLVAITYAIVKAGNIVFAESNCQDTEISVTVAAGQNRIALTNLPASDNDAVTHFAVYMTTAGGSELLRVALVPIASTSYNITAADTALELIPLSYANALLPAKPFVAEHNNRLLLWGDLTWSRGTAAVTQNSATVTLTGTATTRAWENKKFRLANTATAYAISAVNTATGQLTLATNYLGATATGQAYEIAGDPHDLYISNALPLSPEGRDLEDGNTIIPIAQDDGDQPRGLMTDRSLVYCAKRRHIYLLAGDGPANYQREEITKSGGLAGHRAWAQLGDGPIMYYGADGGIYLLSGNTAARVSQPIDPFLSSGVNHARDEWAHAVYYAPLNWWLLCLTAAHQSRVADCWLIADCSRGYTRDTVSWWRWTLPAATSRVLVGPDGVERLILGDYHGGLSVWGAAATDGADYAAAVATHTGVITSATTSAITEATANFAAATVGDLIGVQVAFLSGACAGERRFIASHATNTLTLDTRAEFGGPLPSAPAAGDRYQLGRIDAYWDSPLFGSVREQRRWLQLEAHTDRLAGGGPIDVQFLGQHHGITQTHHRRRLAAESHTSFVVPLSARLSLAQLRFTNTTTTTAAPWRLRDFTLRAGTARGVR
jgi:hypothetical protein